MLTKEQFFSQKRENDNVLWDRLAVVVPVYNTGLTALKLLESNVSSNFRCIN